MLLCPPPLSFCSFFAHPCLFSLHTQGKDLWLQGMITLETLFVEYRADVHVFDHLVHERFHYQVRCIRAYLHPADTGGGFSGAATLANKRAR